MISGEVRFCIRCGTRLAEAQRIGRLRLTCPACDWIYFADPKVAVAALLVKDGKVLLVRRVHEPFRGLWTLPAGFVDAGEDPAQAMIRECLEETGLSVQVVGLLDVLAGQEHPRGADILILYRVDTSGDVLQPGDDVDRAGFFALDSLPPLAFESTRLILEKFRRGPDKISLY